MRVVGPPDESGRDPRQPRTVTRLDALYGLGCVGVLVASAVVLWAVAWFIGSMVAAWWR